MGLWIVALLLAVAGPGRAVMQFDVFVGHGMGANDGAIREGTWFPVICEVFHDGPGFDAEIEIRGGSYGQGQDRLVSVELPSGTRKRILVPFYAPGRWGVRLDAWLRDNRGRVRAEHLNLQPRVCVDQHSPLLGSLARTLAGTPMFPEVRPGQERRQNQLQPATTRLNAELFPDNPLVLEGLSHLYLHAGKAAELKVPQVTALLAWLHGGGHLVVAVEQPSDVNATPWLNGVFPCEVTGLGMWADHRALHSWVTGSIPAADSPGSGGPSSPRRPPRGGTATSANPFARLSPDAAFENAPLSVALVKRRDGEVLIGTEHEPLALTCERGRGRLTALLFSPDLEPFRSWTHRTWFWAKLAGVPTEWLVNAPFGLASGPPIDGVFGAMIDSKQVRKLPMGWLLVLLTAYLAVIGPLDQYWLKKINRPMLTWITFPAYVALFSGLIYLIGYKLRAGEREWNEFHVVDVVPYGERADLRGRSYCSAYSPVNARYAVANDAPFATLRGEQGYGGGQTLSRATVRQQANSFTAELAVPVWTSQLFLSDWWRQGPLPLHVSLRETGGRWQLTVENRTGKTIPNAKLVVRGRVYELGALPATKTFSLGRAEGRDLSDWVRRELNNLHNAVMYRRSAWGRTQPDPVPDHFAAASLASFASVAGSLRQSDPGRFGTFVAPRGFDLSAEVERGAAVLLAYLPDYSPLSPLNRFTPRYSYRETMLRVVVSTQ